MSEGMQRSVNAEAVEEIRDYDTAAIREILESADVVRQGEAITADDYEAILSRAEVLAADSKESVSAKALLSAAYIDRMKFLERLSDQTIKEMPGIALQAYIYAETGTYLDEESIEGLRQSDLDIESWLQGRAEAQRNKAGDTTVAVDEQGAVLARGATPEEAMLRAQEENRE